VPDNKQVTHLQQTNMEGDGWIDGWIDGCFDGCVDGSVNGRVDGRVDGQVDGRADGIADGKIQTVFADRDAILYASKH
jgi:hypothetical protein